MPSKMIDNCLKIAYLVGVHRSKHERNVFYKYHENYFVAAAGYI